MDLALNGLYESLVETLYIDLKDAKKLSEEQLGRFKSYFALEIEAPTLFYNDFNLIIGDAATFQEMETFMKTETITTRVDSREHNLFFVVYPYFNDNLIRQAIEG